jgi:P-type Ca2+ transporter type 2C
MKKLMENCTLAIIIIMVAIPEGLPMVVSVSLAYSTINMFKKDNILVRNLSSPEMMGQVTELLTGCTGTLTTGDMTVQKFYMQDVLVLNNRLDTLNHCVVGP